MFPLNDTQKYRLPSPRPLSSKVTNKNQYKFLKMFTSIKKNVLIFFVALKKYMVNENIAKLNVFFF